MKHIFMYDNPERNYVIGIQFDTWEEAYQRLSECEQRGMPPQYLYIADEEHEKVQWLRDNKFLF